MSKKPVIIETAIDRMDELDKLRKGQIEPGTSTGWPEMDQFYKIIKGQLNVVSGYPGSGKSEWVDSVMIRQSVLNGAEIVYYSPENWPSEILIRKLIEKMCGLPISQISSEKYEDSFAHICTQYHFISSEDRPYTIEEVLLSVHDMIKKGHKLKHLVIDPWNELEGGRAPGMSETDYIGLWLMNCRRFARYHGINIWIVCHPAKPQKEANGKLKVPTLYDLAGSAHWYNKADNAFIVHREDKLKTEMHVFIKKIKNRYYGKLGQIAFNFDRQSGDYDYLPESQTSKFDWSGQ